MRRLASFALLLTSLASPSFAHAEDPAIVEAQSRFNEGLDYADKGNHEAARLKFQQAWAVFRSPAVLYNLARSEQLTGHDIEALDHFRQFLRHPPDQKVSDAQRQRAAQNVEALAKKVGQIEVDAPRGARVTIDGRALDELPKDPVAVTPGRHVVEGVLDGRTKSVTVEAAAGAIVPAKLVFDAPSSPATEPPPPAPTPPSTGRWLVPVILGAAGVAAASVGVGFAVASQNAKEEEDRLRSTTPPGACFDKNAGSCATLKDASDDVSSKATIAWIGYIGGGALIAGAAVTYLLWPSPSSRTGARMLLSPTAGGGTVHFTTRF